MFIFVPEILVRLFSEIQKSKTPIKRESGEFEVKSARLEIQVLDSNSEVDQQKKLILNSYF